MIDNMNIDVNAQKIALSQVVTPSTIQENEYQNVNLRVQLPQRIPYESTPIEFKSDAVAEVSKIDLDPRVKFDAEQHYKHLQSAVDSLGQQLDATHDHITTKWIPDPRPINSFEEKPLLEPTNLVFLERRERFSKLPHWA